MADQEDGLDSPMNIHAEHKTAVEAQQWLTEAAGNAPPGATIKKTIGVNLDYSNPTPYPTGDDALVEITGCQIAASIIDGHYVIDLRVYVPNDDFFKYWSAPSSPDEIKRGDENDTWQTVTRINGVSEVKVKLDGRERIFEEPEVGANYVDIAGPAYPSIIALNPDDLGIYYVYCKGFWQEIDLPFPDDGRQALQELTAQIYDRNTQHEARLLGQDNYISLHPWEQADPTGTLTQGRKSGAPGNRMAVLDATIKTDSSNVSRGTIRALSTPETWVPGLEGFSRGAEYRWNNISMTIGLPDDIGMDALWAFLCKCGPQMIKGYYALFARWYQEQAQRGRYIPYTINQWCADIGHTQHHKGGYRIEAKREAMKIALALTTVEISARYTPPGKNKSAVVLQGSLWNKGLTASTIHYSDIFGQAGIGNPEEWEPEGFTFTTGPWFENEEWAAYNRYVGKMSVGFLHLRNDTDKWPILIGGYFGTLARTNQYRTLRCRVETILKSTGLAQSEGDRCRVKETRTKIERALDRLKEDGIDVIKGWRYVQASDIPTEEITDFDDPDDIENYYTQEPLKTKNWRSGVYEIDLPNEEDNQRLEAQTAAAKAKELAAKRKAGRPKKSASQKLIEEKILSPSAA